MAPSVPSIAPHGEPPVRANVEIFPFSYTSSSPTLPSHSTSRPSPMMTGPSGNPRPDASRLAFTDVPRSAGQLNDQSWKLKLDSGCPTRAALYPVSLVL